MDGLIIIHINLQGEVNQSSSQMKVNLKLYKLPANRSAKRRALVCKYTYTLKYMLGPDVDTFYNGWYFNPVTAGNGCSHSGHPFVHVGCIVRNPILKSWN